MKKIFILFAVSIIIFSCNKTSTPSNAAPLVSSIISGTSNVLVVDSFVYNSTHYVSKVIHYAGQPGAGTEMDFTFGSNGLPVSYMYYNSDYPAIVTHLLSYDAQNRIIKDTSADTLDYTTYFSYPTNDSVIYSNFYNSTQNDTSTISITNGNMTAEERFYSSDSLSDRFEYQYSAYTNPLYNASVAVSIGPLLRAAGYDFISKNLVSSQQQLYSLPQNYHNYTFDSLGRMTRDVISRSPQGFALAVYQYTYY